MAGLQYKRFKDAFRSARAAGDKEFEWEGKKYNTELAKDKPKEEVDEAERTRQRKLMDEPGLESVSPELDVLPIGKIAGAAGAVGAALKGMSTLGKRYAVKKAEEKAAEETAKRASKIAAGKEAAKKTRAKSSGAMEGEAGAGELRYKKGGSVASRRGDGIAMRGKTRGKIC